MAAGQVVVNLEYFYSGVARKCPQVVAIKVLGGEKKKKAVTWIESDKVLRGPAWEAVQPRL